MQGFLLQELKFYILRVFVDHVSLAFSKAVEQCCLATLITVEAATCWQFLLCFRSLI